MKRGTTMGWNFRKSKQLPFGLRLNFSKHGIGFSLGNRLYRRTYTADGNIRDTFTIPKTGIQYRVSHKADVINNNIEYRAKTITDSITNDKAYMDCSKQYELLNRLNIIKSPYIVKIIVVFIINTIILWCGGEIFLKMIDTNEMSAVVALLSFGLAVTWIVSVIVLSIYIIILVVKHVRYMYKNLSIQKMNNIIPYIMRINNLRAPQIIVNCKSLSEFQSIDQTTAIIRAVKEGQSTYRTIIGDNKQILTDVINKLDRIMTEIIKNNQYVSPEYSYELYKLLNMITYSNAGTCLIAKYQYISPAGRNSYQKGWIINYEEALDAYNSKTNTYSECDHNKRRKYKEYKNDVPLKTFINRLNESEVLMNAYNNEVEHPNNNSDV